MCPNRKARQESYCSSLCSHGQQQLAKLRKHSWQVSKQLKTQTTQQQPVLIVTANYRLSANNNANVCLTIRSCFHDKSVTEKSEVIIRKTLLSKTKEHQQHGQRVSISSYTSLAYSASLLVASRNCLPELTGFSGCFLSLFLNLYRLRRHQKRGN